MEKLGQQVMFLNQSVRPMHDRREEESKHTDMNTRKGGCLIGFRRKDLGIKERQI